MEVDIVYGASAAADDSFFLAGATTGVWDAPGAGGWDMVAAKIDANGSRLWVWQVLLRLISGLCSESGSWVSVTML